MATTGLTILDLILFLFLLLYLVAGLMRGFWVTLGGLLGIIGGAIAGYFSVPLVTQLVGEQSWRLPATIFTVLLLVLIGMIIGGTLGKRLRNRTDQVKLQVPERLIGGAFSLIVAALVASMLAAAASNLGVPWVSKAMAESKVITAIDALTPAPLSRALAEARGAIFNKGIPTILGRVPTEQIKIPNENLDTEAYRRASASVVKVSGLAFQCGQNQTGSGFVAAPDRVITNAHVIAGVNEPVVDVPGHYAKSAQVVYFDPQNDIAVLKVDGVGVPAIPLAPTQESGAAGAFAGYPAGGPFQIQPSQIISHSPVSMPDIYGNNPGTRMSYTLAGNVQQGNSGGPLLSAQGQVAGVIFAKAVQADPVGYALSQDILAPVVQLSRSLTQPVEPGRCTSG